MQGKICPHCEPVVSHPYHFSEKIGNLFFSLKRIFLPAGRLLESKFPKLLPRVHRIVLYNLFRALLIARALKESTNFFSVSIKNKKIFFETLPTEDIAKISKIDFDDKYKLKQILKADNLPRAEGECFRSVNKAIAYGKKLGFPLAVKPKLGSLSKHVVCDIQNEADLKKAISVAQIINPEFIVEKFIKGEVYRITLVNYEIAGCCGLEAPNVIGDGIHTIAELIKIKNEHPWRGEARQKNFTLHKISAGESARDFLAKQGLARESVLPPGIKVYLHNKIILKCGADIHDKTDEVHPDNIALFQKVSRLCGASLIGLDFICQDISRSHRRQKCAVLEANSLPYI